MLPVASSLIGKAVGILVLLSSKTDYGVLIGCVVFSLGVAVNLGFETKFLSTVNENEVKNTWLRAVHSMIFPMAPELKTKKHILGVSLQILVGNLAAAALGFSAAFSVGLAEGMFITTNMVKALSMTTVCLVLFSAVVYYGISAQSASSVATPSLEDFEENSDETSDSTTLLDSHDRHQEKEYMNNVLWFLVACTHHVKFLPSSAV